jgi:hypothetical protein
MGAAWLLVAFLNNGKAGGMPVFFFRAGFLFVKKETGNEAGLQTV